MTDPRRAAIFTSIKGRLQQPTGDRPGRLSEAQLVARMQNPPRHLVPARSRLPRAGQVELFISMAEAAAASVQRIVGMDHVPSTLAQFVMRRNLPCEFVLAGELADLPWAAQQRLKPHVRAAQDGDKLAVTGAIAGIAETGTLLLGSGPKTPSTLNFLPDWHIVVLASSAIVGPYEDAFDLLRGQPIPRTLNFITGPSRSADIEQTLQLGAHGPVALHIILVDSEEG